MVSFDMNNLEFYPLIILRISKFTEFMYDNDSKYLHNNNLAMATWLLHSLVAYPQKHFQTCTSAATKPTNLQGIIEHEPIDPMTYKEAEFLLTHLLDSIRSYVIGNNIDMIAYPSITYSLFLPSITSKRKPEDPQENFGEVPQNHPSLIFYLVTYLGQGIPHQLMC